MKAKLIAVLLVMLLTVAGCSSGDGGGSKSNSSGNDRLATINTLMAKGYEMSQNQRETINQLTAEGQKLLSAGKTEEANKQFNEAIKLLEVIAETDRFNKSE